MPMGGGEGAGQPPVPERRAHREQDALWAEVLKLASTVEDALTASMQALREGRADLAAVVKDWRDSIDDEAHRIEKECLRILARYDPTASDLRRMITVLKVADDLERLANQAVHVAKKAEKLFRDPNTVPVPGSLTDLSARVMDSARKSLDSLAAGDAGSARAVIAVDHEIGRECRSLRKELKHRIGQEPERSTYLLRMMSLTRNLEHIADHTSRIAASVIYMKEGTIVHGVEGPTPLA